MTRVTATADTPERRGPVTANYKGDSKREDRILVHAVPTPSRSIHLVQENSNAETKCESVDCPEAQTDNSPETVTGSGAGHDAGKDRNKRGELD
jgi:hypothetical protein